MLLLQSEIIKISQIRHIESMQDKLDQDKTISFVLYNILSLVSIECLNTTVNRATQMISRSKECTFSSERFPRILSNRTMKFVCVCIVKLFFCIFITEKTFFFPGHWTNPTLSDFTRTWLILSLFLSLPCSSTLKLLLVKYVCEYSLSNSSFDLSVISTPSPLSSLIMSMFCGKESIFWNTKLFTWRNL